MDGAAGEYPHMLGFEALPQGDCAALSKKVQAFQMNSACIVQYKHKH